MKTKHILTAMVLPALFAACTQEEVAVEKNAGVDLSCRPVLSNVTLSFDEANTRMSVVDGTDYALTPDATDGLAACIIDEPNYTSASEYATQLEDLDEGEDVSSLYTVKSYISSNYRYDLDADGKWNTQALLSEGHYVFYAPHSENHMLRMPLSVKVPVEQKATKEEPNKAVKDFYANATKKGYPVVIDYKFLKADGQEKTLALNYRHILSYPKFTLKNNYTEKEDGKDVKKAVKVTKVSFSIKNGSKFLVEAPLMNGVKDDKTGVVGKALGCDSLWIKREIEEAATSNVLNTAAAAKDKKESETITVDFGEGIEIAADGTFSFYAVMPAEQYINNSGNKHLVATVYTADNMQFKTGFELKDFTMNPGKRYPAQEYNTREGDEKPELKKEAGTLATISLQGEQIPVQAKATGLSNNEELIEYLSKVATRYRDLKQVNSDFVELNSYNKAALTATGDANYVQYNSGLHFTLAEDAEIVINDELIDALVKYIYKDVTGGSITFLAKDVEAGKVVLGNATKLDKYIINYNGVMNARQNIATTGFDGKQIVLFGTPAAASKITLSTGTTEFKKGMTPGTDKVIVPKDATLTLGDEFAASSLVVENNGGTINVGKLVDIASISNNKGTLNLNANFSKAVTNGALETKEGSTDIQEYTDEELKTKNENATNAAYFVKVVGEGTINIAEGVIASGAIINHPGSTINNNGFMSAYNTTETKNVNKNAGTIVMGEGSNANIGNYDYTNYSGYVQNNAQVAIKSVDDKQIVTCELAAIPTAAAATKFTAAGINTVYITKDVVIAKDVFSSGKVFEIVNEVNFVGGCSKITTAEKLTDVNTQVFRVHNNVEWIGDPMGNVDLSSIKLEKKKGTTITTSGVTLPSKIEEFD